MADHCVVAWNELYESEASWATVFCFDSASTEKACFVGDLVCFIPLCLRVFVFLNVQISECPDQRVNRPGENATVDALLA